MTTETAQDMARRNYAERTLNNRASATTLNALVSRVTTGDFQAKASDITTLNGSPPDDKVNPKTLAGSKKPNLALIPPSAMIQLSRAMELGAEKYGPYNWREKAVPVLTYLAAAQRHILSYLDGEDLDPESGAPHLAHVMACMAIVLDAKEVDMLIDDRPPTGRTGQLIQDLTRNV